MKIMLRCFQFSLVAAVAMMPASGLVSGLAIGQDGAVETVEPAAAPQDLDIDIDINSKGGGPRIIVGGDKVSVTGSYWLGLMLDPEREDEGATVLKVVPDSPAEKAGIKKGDRILKFGGKKIESPEALAGRVKETGGKAVKLVYSRGGATQTVEVKPVRRNVMTADGNFQKWWKELVPGGAGPGNRMLLIRPGMVFPRDAARMMSPRLPEDFSFEVQGQGKDKPARIIIKKGGKSWSVTEDKWEEVPREIRNLLPPSLQGEIALPGLAPGVHIEGFTPPRPVLPPQVYPAPAATRPDRKVERLERMLQQLMRDVKELKHEHHHDHGETPGEAGDAHSDDADRIDETIEDAPVVAPVDAATAIENAVLKVLNSVGGNVRVKVTGGNAESVEVKTGEAGTEIKATGKSAPEAAE